MSAIMVSQVHITNAALFDEYMSKTQRVAARFGAELVTRGRFSSSLAATGPQHGLIVVVRFPSLDDLREWHTSDDYRALVDLRESGSVQVMSVYERAAPAMISVPTYPPRCTDSARLLAEGCGGASCFRPRARRLGSSDR